MLILQRLNSALKPSGRPKAGYPSLQLAPPVFGWGFFLLELLGYK